MTMQPPPRKVKPTVQLKTIHSDQLAKLQQKHQQEIDILEDFRLFAKQRSTIEKEYAQALTKLASQFLSKRDFAEVQGVESADGQPHRTLLEAWKAVLDETNKVAKVRLQAADTISQQIYEPAKTVKNNKAQTSKKVFEQANTLHKEIAVAVQELTKAQKLYNDDEHVAHEARQKALEACEKLKNKSTGIFTSLATLQKNSAKLCTRREACETKSTASRNEYLLALAAANAHHNRYYNVDLPELLKVLDGDMFERIQEFFSTLGKNELDCAKTTLESFSSVLSDADLMSRNYNLQYFLHNNLVFTNPVQYNFEPMDDDQETKVSKDHGADLQLDKEARKWATRVAKDCRAIRESERVMQNLSAQPPANGTRKPSDASEPNSAADIEQKMEEARQVLRKAETSKAKAEARIEALREAGINVDEWLKSAQAESLAAEEEEMRRASSSVSIRTTSSGRGSAVDEQESYANSPAHNAETTYIRYDDDFMEDTFEVTTNHQGVMDTSSTGYSSGRNFPLQCVSLYDFQATNADELTMVENEHIELIADGDGDGWVRAKNAKGEVGFIPENYIQVLSEQDSLNGTSHDPNEMNVDHDGPVIPNQDGTSQVSAERTSAYSASDYEVQDAMQTPTQETINAADGVWARALYDYEATAPEELTFQEGQLIRILRKDENGVDDGWWEGEINGKKGVFPSLVVEELAPQGLPAGQVLSPDRPGPPPFTPPQPGPPPPQLELTLPTPTDETSGHFRDWPYRKPQESVV